MHSIELGALGRVRFSALQRAEIAEIRTPAVAASVAAVSFSALQRAEIAEILRISRGPRCRRSVSVLFNEPKLLKFLIRLQQ